MITLRGYQQQGVEWLLGGRVRGLAFDAGLGKTDTLLSAVKRARIPAVILCPASVRVWWRAKTAEYRVSASVFSYAEAVSHPPKTPNRFILIADEAQAVKNPTSARTKAFLKLAKNATHVWLASATPATHSPADYYVPLSLLRPLPPLPVWIRQYCRVLAGQYGDKVVGWKPGGKDAMRAELQKLWMFRSWRDCLKEVPPITFSYLPLEEEEAVGIIRGIEAELPGIREVIEDIESQEANLTRVRHLMGVEKARVVGPYLRDKLEGDWAGQRIVVYGEFLDSLNTLHSKVSDLRPVVHLRGDMPESKRQAAIQYWKSTPGCVLLAQIRAAGVGLNLPESRVVVIAEGTWSPADWWQAASRCRRIEDPHPVLVECPYIAGTVDEALVKTIARKAELIGVEL